MDATLDRLLSLSDGGVVGSDEERGSTATDLILATVLLLASNGWISSPASEVLVEDEAGALQVRFRKCALVETQNELFRGDGLPKSGKASR